MRSPMMLEPGHSNTGMRVISLAGLLLVLPERLQSRVYPALLSNLCIF